MNLNPFKPALQNLKHRYPGFKILRGVESFEPRKLLTLQLIKVTHPRTGIFTRFCNDRMKEGYSLLVISPTNQAMVDCLHKIGFVRFNSDAWIVNRLLIERPELTKEIVNFRL